MMDPKVLFEDKIIKKLVNSSIDATTPFLGILYGLASKSTYLISGYYSFEESNPRYFAKQVKEASNYIPHGYTIFGFFLKTSPLPQVVNTICKKIFSHANNKENTYSIPNDNVLVLSLDEKFQTGDKIKFKFGDGSFTDGVLDRVCLYWYRKKVEVCESLPVTIATDGDVTTMKDRFNFFHIQARLPLRFHHTNELDDKKLSVQHSINNLATLISSPLTLYKVKSIEGKLFRNSIKSDDDDDDDDDGDEENEDDGDGEDGEKLGGGGGGSGGGGGGVRDSFNSTSKVYVLGDYAEKVLQVEVLLQSTGVLANEFYLPCVPVLFHDHMKIMLVDMILPIDVILLVAKDDPSTNSMARLFSNEIKKQLRILGECLLTHSRSSVYYTPRPFHFLPHDLDAYITIIYPDGMEEKQLATVRKDLHSRFLVPLSTPTFRRPNSLKLCGDDTPYLLDVHLGLPPSKVKGQITQVRGSYAYHHYMQDRVDDGGWGCAYRSLQTIASWLYMQGYTEKQVPTHRQIQQALVEVGDKLPSFLGSKQWIGSTEVSYVLDHIYNVQCKISHASSGTEMSSKVREIIHHFETQGSPIMIGGGVLAHTIIGIDFNEDTGDVAYLVLDPHYTGSEDVKVIQNKGWCGWKGPDFWKANSFYNMCMPLKPTSGY